MAFKDTLTAVRYYTEGDVYFYTYDNLPIATLDTRDQELADQIDKISRGRVEIVGNASFADNGTYVKAKPTGWTIARDGAGLYTVTHNLALGADGYSVIGTCYDGTTPYILFVTTRATNSFQVSTVTLGGVATDVKFSVLMTQL